VIQNIGLLPTFEPFFLPFWILSLSLFPQSPVPRTTCAAHMVGKKNSTQAIQLYDMLGIRKERIDPSEPLSEKWSTAMI
jgi:hypothetical protein